MSNFTFLRDEFPELWEATQSLEAQALNDPRAACFYARRGIELLVFWLFDHETALQLPYSRKLAVLLEVPSMKEVVPPEILAKFHFVRQLGNLAVHSGKRIKQYDAVQAAREVFHCCFWLFRTYTRFDPKMLDGVKFDQSALPDSREDPSTFRKDQLRALEETLSRNDRILAEKMVARADTDQEIERLRKEIAAAKRRNLRAFVRHDYAENETRDQFIDLLLKDAGWDPEFNDGNLKCAEYRVTGMPGGDGSGFVDYVLWSDQGNPLAVVEAKRTRKDARVGQTQARLYANCLEQQTGVRPIIFYTNGYEHWIWDDERFPPRRIQGFLKQEELELMIERRQTARDLSTAYVDKNIAGRYYQEQAIRHITESLLQSQRKTLVVMATGAGKTRMVVALCDLLQRCNWVKRVLFLADRVALVKQAVNAFKTHLPHSNPVNLVTDNEDASSRVYVSTYPTIMGLIDASKDGLKRFGVGHFDLVIVDEAHRSVYRKYRAIFEYFDALLVGLTATPRDEVDRDTYALFELNRGVPTYAYELEQAVSDGYLVPPRLVSVPIRIPREGVNYKDLSDDEKEQWDMTEWDDEGNVPDAVEAAAVNQWLFNADTVDKVLEHLMRKGLRVAAGQEIGKTIIFAKNHNHAVFIQERFDANYPHLKGRFARVIDNQESYAQNLIEKFSSKKPIGEAPRIVISVDMMDTGIDVPDVLNLVFFKIVRSKTKFWQMIGRGTRLCPDVFDVSEDKNEFFVFDFCGNFEFFNEFPEGVDGSNREPIQARIFRQRLDLLESIRRLCQGGDARRMVAEPAAKTRSFEDGLVDALHSEVASMPLENFIVRSKRQAVERFQQRENWDALSENDLAELHRDVAGLPNKKMPEDPTAKYFDLLLLRLQHGILEQDPGVPRMIQSIRLIASELEQVQRIPEVKAQMILIQEIQSDEYWRDVTLPMLEVVRLRLRGLVCHIEKRKRKIVTTNFADEIGESVEVKLEGLGAAIDRVQYKKRFLAFLDEHANELALQKVRHNQSLTEVDLGELERILFESGSLGSREQFEECYGHQSDLGLFLRRLVGLDRKAAKTAFGRYLDENRFNSKQIAFINQIIDYLTQNGVMDPKLLFEHPFTNLAPEGPISVFSESETAGILEIIKGINLNAGGM